MATNLQHEAIGVVSATRGEVFARGANGEMRRLAIGDTVFEGDVIVTANGSSAEIAPFNGPVIEVQEQQTVSVDSQLAPAAGNDATVGVIAPLGSTEAATVIQAVGGTQAGQDFNATLDEEAAAAGLAGGEGGGGRSFVDLLRIVETVPGVGYEFPTNPAGTSPIITGETMVPTTTPSEAPPLDVLSPMLAAYTQLEGTEQAYTVIPGTSSLGSPASIVPGQYTGSLGTVVIVDAEGHFSYTAPVTDESQPEVFVFNTVDGNGATSTSTVTFGLLDAGPTAFNDGGTVIEDAASHTLTGNVLTNDTTGPDVPSSLVAWDSASAAAAHAVLDQYGTLTLNPDGTWSFVLDNSLPAVQHLTASDRISETIGYTMQDADGTPSQAALTITVQGADDSASVITASAQGADSTVYEHGLTSPADTSEVTSGTFTVTATDGIANIVIGGTTGGDTTITLGQLTHLATTPVSMDTGEGTLVLTGYNDASGQVSYTYTLKGAISTDAAGSFEDGLTVTVNGIGGTHASDNLVIGIIDDTPTLSINDLEVDRAAGEYSGTGTFAPGADVPPTALGLEWTNMPAGYTFTPTGDSTWTAYSDGNAFFDVTMNPDGSYAFNLENPLPSTEQSSGNLLSDFARTTSKMDSYTFDSSHFDGVFSLVLTATNDHGAAKLWLSNTDLGINSDSIQEQSHETLKIDVVQSPGYESASLASLTLGIPHVGSLHANDQVALTVVDTHGTSHTETVTYDGGGSLTFDIAAGTAVDYVTMTPVTHNATMKVDSVSLSYTQPIDPADMNLNFTATGYDSDGDPASSDFTVTLIAGTAGNDVIHTGSGSDQVTGGMGSDTMTGGAGADAFVWHLADLGTAGAPAHDVVTDFNAAQGDKLDLTDVLSTGNTLNAVADSANHLVVQVIGSAGVVQDITLQTVAAIDNTAANDAMHQMLANHQILVNG